MLAKLNQICVDVEAAYEKFSKLLKSENDMRQFVLNDSTVSVEMAYENRLEFFR